MRSEAQLVQHTHPVRRGWPWFVAAFILCPCNIPILLAVLGTSALGGVLAQNQLVVILGLGVAFTFALVRGFSRRRYPDACAACREEEGGAA